MFGFGLVQSNYTDVRPCITPKICTSHPGWHGGGQHLPWELFQEASWGAEPAPNTGSVLPRPQQALPAEPSCQSGCCGQALGLMQSCWCVGIRTCRGEMAEQSCCPQTQALAQPGGVACVALPGAGAVTAWLFNAGNQLPADRSRQCQKSQIAAPDKKRELGDLAWVL